MFSAQMLLDWLPTDSFVFKPLLKLGFVNSGFSNKYCDWVLSRWEQFFDFAAYSSNRDPQHTRKLDEFVVDFHLENTKSVR
jgi:hypothetical protein